MLKTEAIFDHQSESAIPSTLQPGLEINMVSVCLKSLSCALRTNIRKGRKNQQTAIKMILIWFLQKSNFDGGYERAAVHENTR